MTIHLPKDLERGIRAAVHSGAFASEDEAIAGAVRQFLKKQPPSAKTPITEEELKRQMLASGLMTQLPDTSADYDDPDDELIDIEGEPLSETVIRERLPEQTDPAITWTRVPSEATTPFGDPWPCNGPTPSPCSESRRIENLAAPTASPSHLSR